MLQDDWITYDPLLDQIIIATSLLYNKPISFYWACGIPLRWHEMLLYQADNI